MHGGDEHEPEHGDGLEQEAEDPQRVRVLPHHRFPLVDIERLFEVQGEVRHARDDGRRGDHVGVARVAQEGDLQ